MIDCINPATLEVIGRVAEWSEEMVTDAMARAAAAAAGNGFPPS